MTCAREHPGDEQPLLPLDEVGQMLIALKDILGPPCHLNADFRVG